MKIGIVSDSHGHADRLRRALALLRQRGIEALVHCGDLGSPECLEALSEVNVPAYAVVGNTDLHPEALDQEAQRWGVHLGRQTVLVALGADQYLGVAHGHNAQVLTNLLTDGRCPYVCHGHTHRRSDERIGRTRVINPGALHHAHPRTVAVLDTLADTVEFVEVG
jgi:hypothetical protein